MKIAILGASGRTGNVLVEQALARGHTVTAVVRDPVKMTPADNLTIVRADVLNEEDLAKVFKGHDAVVSTLGSNSVKLQLIEHSTKAIISAMQKNGVKRFVAELSFGAATNLRFSRVVRIGLHLVLSKMLVDQTVGIRLLRASQLEWTIVFPTVLTDGPLTEEVHVLKNEEKVGVRYKISRNDVAYFMLEVLENHSFLQEEVAIVAV